MPQVALTERATRWMLLSRRASGAGDAVGWADARAASERRAQSFMQEKIPRRAGIARKWGLPVRYAAHCRIAESAGFQPDRLRRILSAGGAAAGAGSGKVRSVPDVAGTLDAESGGAAGGEAGGG